MKKKIVLLFALFLCAALCGCAQAEDEIVVTATFYPVYLSALNVTAGVEGVSLKCLTPPTAGCLHDYQMTAADRRLLADSDVIIANGAGLETFLEKLMPQLDAALVEASAGLELLCSRSHDHDHDHDHDHGDYNPHVWVGISGTMHQVRVIADALSQLDPANAAKYAENAQAYLEKLDALRAQTEKALAPLADKPIVTFHEAFDYYAAEFGLNIAAVVQHEEGSAPSAREIAEVIGTIEQTGVRALFAEPQYTDDSIELIARETGLPVYTLDPVVSGEADENDPDAYLRIMQENLATLTEALP